jgi:hypothetical protein
MLRRIGMGKGRIWFGRIAVAGLLAVFWAAVYAESQPDPQEAAAEEVARAYLVARKAQGFGAAVEFMHPEEMARFQAMLLPAFEAEARAGRRTLINATFGPGATLTDVRQAHPADFMRHFARVMTVRLSRQPIGFDELVVVGSVAEGDRRYVVARMVVGSGDTSLERVEVVTLRPYEGTWKLVLGSEIEDAARSMGRGATHGPRAEPRPPFDGRAGAGELVPAR